MIPVRYNLRSLMVRRTTSAMTALVVALVVMVLFILSGFIAGIRATVMQSAISGDWIVTSRAANSEPASYVSREQYEIVRSRPQLVSDGNGNALISPEMMTGFYPAPDNPPAKVGYTFLRGVYPVAYQVHRDMKIVSGRWPRHGASEMVVGRKLAARYPNLALGSDIRFGHRVWKVVGIFSDQNSTRESEVWTDLDVLTQDIRYNAGFAALHVMLKPGSGEAFEQSLSTDARLRLDAIPEREFYRRESGFVDQLRMLGLLVASILAVGSIFGGMNTMYSAVARRTNEVGVLRVLGFSRLNVLASFVIESALLGIAGGLAGIVLGLITAGVTGLASQLMSVGAYIFTFRLTPSAFVFALIAGAILGALGGLLPAWRASRIGVVESLRTV
jgi:ABC-type lipoprotein release transport system permease subunit